MPPAICPFHCCVTPWHQGERECNKEVGTYHSNTCEEWLIITPAYQQLQHMHFKNTRFELCQCTLSLQPLPISIKMSVLLIIRCYALKSQMPELSLYWTFWGGFNLPTSAWLKEINTEMVFIKQLVTFLNLSTYYFKCCVFKTVICSFNYGINCDWWNGIN